MRATRIRLPDRLAHSVHGDPALERVRSPADRSSSARHPVRRPDGHACGRMGLEKAFTLDRDRIQPFWQLRVPARAGSPKANRLISNRASTISRHAQLMTSERWANDGDQTEDWQHDRVAGMIHRDCGVIPGGSRTTPILSQSPKLLLMTSAFSRVRHWRHFL